MNPVYSFIVPAIPNAPSVVQTKQVPDPAEYATHDLGQRRKRDRSNENSKKRWKTIVRSGIVCRRDCGARSYLAAHGCHPASAVLLLLADDTVLIPSLLNSVLQSLAKSASAFYSLFNCLMPPFWASWRLHRACSHGQMFSTVQHSASLPSSIGVTQRYRCLTVITFFRSGHMFLRNVLYSFCTIMSKK
jgi:hypothetical protein